MLSFIFMQTCIHTYCPSQLTHTYLSSVHAHRPPHEEEVGVLLGQLRLLCENARRKRGGHPNLQYLFIGIHALTFTPPTRTLFFRSERSDTKQSKIRLGLFHYFWISKFQKCLSFWILNSKQIKHMKDYVAKFGQGNAKMARQAQSKEKTLEKMLRVRNKILKTYHIYIHTYIHTIYIYNIITCMW